MNALAHSFMLAFNTMWSSVAFSGSATSQVIVEWNDGDGNVVAGSDATPVSGGGSGGFTPASVAWVISWRISPRYRGGHPRTYLAGIDRVELADQVSFVGSSVTALQASVNTFFNAINALTPAPFTSVTLGVLRQFANGGSTTKPPTFLTPPQFIPFTGGVVKPGVATQRRRLGDNFN